MNITAKQAVQTFLTSNKLNPEQRDTDDESESWLFDIAENLQSELFCYEVEANDITAIIMTSVQIKSSDNATTLAAAICPALAPAAVITVGEVLSLRMMVRGDAASIGGLLEEGILISRHIIASVFPRIVELAEGKIPMQNAMVMAMQALQGEQSQQQAG
ncbi:hypothetical protein [Parendozoicomonas haliclonae]|uniref:Uncharacterized protein n=1 Tax=Parendozoicomonas haliclonae TaxID=1960125 RepID=A0A1X7AQX0_9GAMM|nr:hypothetical protein [Parendozoicomonas haliclonae]SMA49807.1 hypothetical protein EHSB41UT_03596 [Parendozoicomonas haliclonae]